jgi:hypothetical protein
MLCTKALYSTPQLSYVLGCYMRAAGQYRGGEGEMAWSLCFCWARGGQGGARERTRGLSGSTHFGFKSETGIGARRRLRTTLSVWIVPLGRVIYPHGHVQIRDGRLRRPGGDALKSARESSTDWSTRCAANDMRAQRQFWSADYTNNW